MHFDSQTILVWGFATHPYGTFELLLLMLAAASNELCRLRFLFKPSQSLNSVFNKECKDRHQRASACKVPWTTLWLVSKVYTLGNYRNGDVWISVLSARRTAVLAHVFCKLSSLLLACQYLCVWVCVQFIEHRLQAALPWLPSLIVYTSRLCYRFNWVTRWDLVTKHHVVLDLGTGTFLWVKH